MLRVNGFLAVRLCGAIKLTNKRVGNFGVFIPAPPAPPSRPIRLVVFLADVRKHLFSNTCGLAPPLTNPAGILIHTVKSKLASAGGFNVNATKYASRTRFRHASKALISQYEPSNLALTTMLAYGVFGVRASNKVPAVPSNRRAIAVASVSRGHLSTAYPNWENANILS